MTEEIYVTPLVRATAQRLSVDLHAVAGTGVGGRISMADVRAAAPAQIDRQGTSARVAAVTGRQQPRLLVRQRSKFTPLERMFGTVVKGLPPMVEIDAFARNPLVDDMRQAVPDQYAQAVKRGGQPPTLFVSGDLPLFTASGIDPELLLSLPWVMRHSAASSASGQSVSQMFEDFGSPDEQSYEAALAHAAGDGWEPGAHAAYDRRFGAWASTDPARLAWDALVKPGEPREL